MKHFWLMALCAASIFSPSHADIKVSERAPHAAFWRKIYSSVPVQWKTERMLVIEEVSGHELRRMEAENEDADSHADSEDEDTDIDGCYQNKGASEPIRISLRETLRGEEAALVFLHEYGHFVWDEILTEDQQREYSKLWREQKRAHRLITEYAETSADEGFADAFAYFLRQPKELRRKDARSLHFLATMQGIGSRE